MFVSAWTTALWIGGGAVTRSWTAQQAFRQRADVVYTYAGVRDASGKVLWDLRPDDFEIRDQGRVREIGAFAREIQPFSVAVVLDRSGSYGVGILPARDFLLCLDERDRSSLRTLTEVIRPLTAGPAQLDPLDLFNRRESSPVWAGVEAAILDVSTAPGRRVVFMLTDGWDTESYRVPLDLVRLAHQHDVVLYGGMPASAPSYGKGGMPSEEDYLAARGRNMVKSLAQLTGGRTLEWPGDRHRAQAYMAMRDLADELRRQYLIGFTPSSLDGKHHELEVRVKRRGAQVTSRRGYLAR